MDAELGRPNVSNAVNGATLFIGNVFQGIEDEPCSGDDFICAVFRRVILPPATTLGLASVTFGRPSQQQQQYVMDPSNHLSLRTICDGTSATVNIWDIRLPGACLGCHLILGSRAAAGDE